MTDNKEGMMLGAYRIISQIGQGGMATVYKAYQASMDRYVALKVLPLYHTRDSSFTQRFIQEARIIARLEHTNILPVFDFGEDAGITYMAMRYLNGGTLQDVLAAGKLTLPEIANIMRQICAGLDYAHRQGIVHRDVKPSNTMIDDEGTVYLTDFGFAKVLESSSELTVSGAVMGTPLYMAPEQSVGGEVDGRTDIYAAGVILYEMATGQPPFQAETPMAVVMAHIHNPLPLPRDVNPHVPEEVQLVILKALSKKPADRYQTANEMAEALTKAVQQSNVAAESPTLSILTAEVRENLASKAILPTDENFTPVSPSATIQAAPPTPSLKLIIGGIGVTALVVIAIFLGIIFWGNSPNEASTPTVPPSAKAAIPVLYDDFNNSDYDGTVNTRIWRTAMDDACSIIQDEGILVITNNMVDYEIDTCDILVGQPESVKFSDLENIEAKMLYAGDPNSNSVGQSLMYSVDLANDNYWYGLCGPEVSDNEIVAGFWVAHISANGEVLEEYYSSLGIETDVWYTYLMEVDSEAGTLSCLLDETLIGSTDLSNVGNLDKLQAFSFERGLTAWRAPNTVATTKVDDFWLIP